MKGLRCSIYQNPSGNFSAGTITASLSGNATGLSGNPNVTLGTLTVNSGSTFSAINNEAALGAELITNGTFTGNATGWTLGAGWSYSSNKVICTTSGSAEGTLSQSISVVSGEYYLITWNQQNSFVGGATIIPSIGSVQGAQNAWDALDNTFSAVLRANTTGSVTFALSVNDFVSFGTVTIDNISVKKLTKITPQIYLPSTTGGELKCEIRTQQISSFEPNIGIGYGALQFNTTGWYNTALGSNALSSNTAGYYNTAVGSKALNINTNGKYNTAVADVGITEVPNLPSSN